MKTDTQTIINLLRGAGAWLGKASAEGIQKGCVGEGQLDKIMQGCGDMADALQREPVKGFAEACADCTTVFELWDFVQNHWDTPAAHEPTPDPWREENPSYPTDEWAAECRDGDTRLGYWEWVEHRKEADEHDSNA